MIMMILKRLLWMVPTLFFVSILTFIIIQAPPGDYLTSYISALQETGDTVSSEQAEALRAKYDLDQPAYKQYWYWMFGRKDVDGKWVKKGVIRGDYGMSFEWNKPVKKLIGERIILTVTLSVLTLLVTWAIAIPVGIYSAMRQYSIGDYIFTTITFLGVATPNFLLALILLYISYTFFGISPGGLFSAKYLSAPWSIGRFFDLVNHLWAPILIVGMANAASTIRVMRGNLLDELQKPYVKAAVARGLPFWRVVWRYPVRMAINPIISTVGWVLPGIISGAAVTEMVLGLPSTGPLLLQSLMNQDMYLAGTLIMMMSVLTVIGTLISDILLYILDPRIRTGNTQ